MPANNTPAIQRAKELCRQFPNAPNRQLGRMLYAEFQTHYRDEESARSAIRTIRGVNGDRQRRVYKTREPWEPKQAGWKPKLPPSQVEAWTPIEIAGPARVLSLSDIHCPFHDERALTAAVEHGRKLKPDTVVLLGDVIDFYSISRFERHPGKRDAVSEISATKELLGWLRSKFRRQRFIYMIGNHERRWQTFVWNKCEELWQLSGLQFHNVLDFDGFGIELCDDRPIMAGKLPMLHGHELQKGIAAPVNQARGAFMKTMHSLIVGHGHRTSTHCEPDIFGREVTCWSQGHLSDPHPAYARANKFNWGFAFIDVAANGEFNVNNFRISPDYQVRAA